MFTCRRGLLVGLALVIFRVPAHGQFTDPRTYQNAPVGMNQLELAYAYARSNTAVDTSLIVAGAELNVNQGTVNYTRSFGLLRRLAWVEGSIPIASLSGSISGTKISGSTTGAGDSSYQLAALLKGGPALSVAQFETYNPVTTVGASLSITAPTGLYNPNKVLNLGSHRWSFKPEFAVSCPFGPEQKWAFDGYANIEFFTDNTSYHGKEILRQQALPGLEGHISYSFSSNFWASVDARYSFRGDSYVDGVNQNNAQQNFALGSEVNLSLNAQNSLVFEFAKSLVHRNGPVYTGFAVRYDYSWGKGYKR